MKEFLRALSARAEFVIVIVTAFGLSVLANVIYLFDPAAFAGVSAITDESLKSLVVEELVLLALLGSFLKARGWTLERFGLSISARDTTIGLAMAILAIIVSYLLQIIAENVVPQILPERESLIQGQLSLFTVVMVSVVNPVFEEVFVCGYLISALKEKRGTAFAINVSVGLRVAYHLYQGALSVLTIAPLGLMFAYWYVRSGRLWPVIVAHGVLDFVALVSES
jgi:membrane protease YdiL (CAAX protease family)